MKLKDREDAKTEITIILTDDSKIEMNVAGKKITVNRGKWSEWVEVKFKLGLMKTVTGISKFFSE